jgi:sortase A
MPLLPRRKRPLLRWASWLFFALGIASLGYVGFSLLDAQRFQASENRRFDDAVKQHTANAHPPPAPTIVASPPPDQLQRTNVALGAVLGRIEISRIGVAVIIAEGTGSRTLQRAVGHVTGTALPGGQGNVAIAGHRDTFFRALRNIQRNDEIILTTLQGSYRYRVDSIRIVGPENTEVLRDSGESILTLVTCYPFYLVGPAPRRFVVRAHQN